MDDLPQTLFIGLISIAVVTGLIILLVQHYYYVASAKTQFLNELDALPKLQVHYYEKGS